MGVTIGALASVRLMVIGHSSELLRSRFDRIFPAVLVLKHTNHKQCMGIVSQGRKQDFSKGV